MNELHETAGASKTNIAVAVCISVACVLSALILAVGFKNITGSERTVSVRGLAVREVDADFAIWPMTFSVGSNDMNQLQRDIVAKVGIVVSFLNEHGLDASEYFVQAPDITDNTMNSYFKLEENKWLYIAKTTVLIRTENIEAIKKALDDSLNLLGKGVAISKNYDCRIQYIFTGLNDIKPEMIAEATKNARAAAEQFARDSLSKVGKIKKASQGLFTVENAAPGLSEKQEIRVVTSVEYILAD